MKNTARIFLILLFSVSAISAQIYIADNAPSNYYKLAPGIDLTSDEQDFADDLSYILDQLEKDSRDYIKYFALYDNPYAQKLQNKLITTLISLKTDRYCIDIKTLEDDIRQLTEIAGKAESKLKNNSDARPLYRNIRTFRNDMELLISMIDQDLKSLKPDKDELDHIRQYLKQQRYSDPEKIHYNQALMKFSVKIREQFEKQKAMRVELAESHDEYIELEEALELVKELRDIYALELEDFVTPMLESMVVFENSDSSTIEIRHTNSPTLIIPKVPEVHPIPDVVVLSTFPAPLVQPLTGLRKKYSDSIFITSTKTPIVIKNKIGDIEVIGWNKSMVKAVFNITLIAESQDAAEEFADKVDLTFISDNKAVLVQTEIPTLRNPERKIINSKLTVLVPKENKINCQTSFGKAYFKDLEWVNLDGTNTEVIITGVSENVRTSLTKSSIMVEDCQGELTVKNSGGKIYINNCESNIYVENSYAPISIKDCTGELKIRNNNNIRVSSQTGPTDIDNKNGIVQVDDLTGGIKVRNAFKPMILTNISGGAELYNKNSIIKIDNVTGKIIAINRAGEIIGKNISGPIHIKNESGATTLKLNNYFIGPSSIVSSYSMIKIQLDSNPNLLLSTPSKGSKLLGNFFKQAKYSERSNDSVSHYIIGKGTQTLNIEGDNNTVIVSQDETDLD